jgi:hypothetical protein
MLSNPFYKLHTLFTDIRFWIVLFFVIRMYGITNPPLEVAHIWRQVTVNMVARNFLETDSNILYPRVDMAGDKTGITGMEFPLLNYSIYLLSLIFGFEHWYGRLINLIVTSVGIYFFYLILKRFISQRIAFYSSLILLVSIWFMYGRKIMPDTFSMSLVLIGMYYSLVFMTDGKSYRVLLFLVFSGFGVLSKLPSGYILGLLVLPLLDITIPAARKWPVVITCTLILLFTSVWYFCWVPHLVKTFGYWHFYMGTSFHQGFSAIIRHAGGAAEKFYFSALFSFVALALFAGGLILAFIRKERLLIRIMAISTFLFLIFMVKAGYTFTRHSYYVIPYVPVMALFGGYALHNIRNSLIRTLLIAAVIVEALANQQHDFRIHKDTQYYLGLEKIADSVSGRQDKILINGGFNPVDIYYTHRKGWTMETVEIFKDHNLDSVMANGCKFLFLNINELHDSIPALPYRLAYEDDHFKIYTLMPMTP